MSLTVITITGTFLGPDGQVAQGSITAELSKPIRNGTEEIEDTPISGQLNFEGELVAYPLTPGTDQPFRLVANDDVGTEPTGTHYRFTINLDNAPVRSFFATVSHTALGHTVDLSELEP